MRCKVLKYSNDTPNLNIHKKYTNCNIIEIYRNILNTTTQVFIAMDYLIIMSEKYLYFRKRKKHLYIFRIMCLPKICTKTYKNWNNSGRTKVDNFRKSVSF